MAEKQMIQWLAILIGVIMIAAPLARILMSARRPVARTIGSGVLGRRWPAAAATTAGLVIIGFLLWRPLPLSLPPALDGAIDILGLLLYLAGAALYLWGLVSLGSQFGVSSVSGADLLAGHKLVAKGPFKLVRHPMYLGVLLAAPGALLIFRTWAMLLFAPMSLVVLLRAEHEERLLEAAYGEEWLQYAKRVPKWFPRFR